jgi:hypothetical protein
MRSRFAVSFAVMIANVLRVMACGAVIGAGLGACGGADGPNLNNGDGGGTGKSYAGGHGIAFYHLNGKTASTISTPAMKVQPTGSTILVSVGRGDNRLFALPTDNKGNAAYVQQGDVHAYTQYPDSGTALYTLQNANGGDGFQVTTSTGINQNQHQPDEVTIAAVEVAASGKIQQVAWTEVPGGDDPVTSKSVTTNGPATLVSFWWGDGFYPVPQHAAPNNDFTVIDSNVQEQDSFVQCAVAVKTVTAAGTYDVTWTGGSADGAKEGGQVWLIAVE